jgi:hypothetical protein
MSARQTITWFEDEPIGREDSVTILVEGAAQCKEEAATTLNLALSREAGTSGQHEVLVSK